MDHEELHQYRSFVGSVKEIFQLKALPQLLLMTLSLSIQVGVISGIVCLCLPSFYKCFYVHHY